MKPHEETLTVEAFSHAEDSPRCLVSKSDNRLVACFRGGDTKDWESLLAAAPEMARALLGVLHPVRMHSARETGSLHTPACITSAAPCIAECSAIRSALIKGGVPL